MTPPPPVPRPPAALQAQRLQSHSSSAVSQENSVPGWRNDSTDLLYSGSRSISPLSLCGQTLTLACPGWPDCDVDAGLLEHGGVGDQIWEGQAVGGVQSREPIAPLLIGLRALIERVVPAVHASVRRRQAGRDRGPHRPDFFSRRPSSPIEPDLFHPGIYAVSLDLLRTQRPRRARSQARHPLGFTVRAPARGRQTALRLRMVLSDHSRKAGEPRSGKRPRPPSPTIFHGASRTTTCNQQVSTPAMISGMAIGSSHLPHPAGRTCPCPRRPGDVGRPSGRRCSCWSRSGETVNVNGASSGLGR